MFLEHSKTTSKVAKMITNAHLYHLLWKENFLIFLKRLQAGILLSRLLSEAIGGLYNLLEVFKVLMTQRV